MNVLRSISYTLLATTVLGSAQAQVHVLWQRASAGNADESLFDGARAANGDFVVCGDVATSSGRDVLCARIAPNGSTVWRRQRDFAGNDSAYTVALDANDVAACFGTTEVFVIGQNYGSCVGWAPDGSLAFAQAAPALSGFSGGVSTGAGSYVLSSLVQPASCFAPNTSCNWSDTWSGFEPSYHALVHDGAGAVYSPGTRNFSQFALRKTAPGGTVAWSLEIPGTAPGGFQNRAYAVALGGTQAVYAAGCTENAGTGIDAVIVRCDAGTGAIQWSRTIDGGLGGADCAVHVAVAPNGDVYVAGYTAVTSAQGFDAFVRRYASDGTLLGQAIHDGPSHGEDGASWVGVDASGDVWVCGTQGSAAPTGAPVCHVTVLRYDAQLVLQEVFANDVGTQVCDIPWNATFAPGRGIYVAGTRTENMTGAHRSLALRIGSNARTACLGDASATPCPCGNSSAAGARQGCVHSLGTGGRLAEAGLASLTADDFQLVGSSMPDSPALYLQSTSALASGNGVVFGDGLRCLGGNVTRLAIRQNVAGGSRYPDAGDAPVSVRGFVAAPGERVYQVWFRDSAAYCTSATFNTTGALITTWEP